jgi:hypothetical protein
VQRPEFKPQGPLLLQKKKKKKEKGKKETKASFKNKMKLMKMKTQYIKICGAQLKQY